MYQTNPKVNGGVE